MTSELPTADGWYVDSGGFMWRLDDGEWEFYGEPSRFQPRHLPTFRGVAAYGPMTRMLPVNMVEGMLGRDLIAEPKPWPDSSTQ